MIRRLFARSTAFRFILIIASFLIVGQFAFTWFSYQKEFDNQRQDLHQAMVSDTRLLAAAGTSSLRQNDFYTLEKLVQEIQADPELVHVAVFDSENRLVTQSINENDPLIQAAIEASGSDSREAILDYLSFEQELEVINQPIIYNDAKIGQVQTRYTLQTLESRYSTALIRSLFFVPLRMLVLIIMTTVLFRRQIEQPIRRLEEATKQFADGNLSVRADVNGTTDIPRLSAAFNRMAGRIEQNLIEMEKLSYVASRTDNPILILDQDSSIVWINEAFTKSTEYTLEEVIGCSPRHLITGPETDIKTLDAIAEAFDAGRSIQCEILNYSKSGRSFWVSIDAHPVHDDHGNIINYVIVETDITEKKNRAKRIKTREAQLRAMLAAMPSPIAIRHAGDQTVPYANDAFKRLFGYLSPGAPELISADFFKNEDDAQEIARSLEFERPVDRIELRCQQPDGTDFWAMVSIQPIEYFGVPSFLYSFYDTNERHQAEEAMRIAKEAAEAAAQAKTDFLTIMTHELRTPLNGVIGMTSLLEDTEMDEEQADYVNTIRSSGDSLMTIIDDILDYSKIESGTLELEDFPLNLRQTAEQALELVEHSAFEKGLEVILVYEPSAPEWIQGDASRIRQILVNLLSNAVKFTEYGDVILTIGQGSPDNPNSVQFSISDTGIGIPAKRMDHLFQPFSQVDTSTTRKYGGTGIGLSTSLKLAQMMGGRMWAMSKPGVGSTFFFTIQAERAESSLTQPILNIQNQHALIGKKVLVVDDHPINRAILSEYLVNWQIDVTTASSVIHGLKQIESRHFDAIILDGRMPDQNGLKLVEQLRQMNVDIPPILMMIEDADHLLQRQAKALQISHIVCKPIQKVQLLSELLFLMPDKDKVDSSYRNEKLSRESLSIRYPLRILLADDNIINQKIAVRTLERLGYTIDTAANGQEAIEAVMTKIYDLILMDLTMPILDGREAASRIRQLPSLTARPVIAAMTTIQETPETISDDFDLVLSKPIRVEDLVNLLVDTAEMGDRQSLQQLFQITATAPSDSTESSIENEDRSPGPSYPTFL